MILIEIHSLIRRPLHRKSFAKHALIFFEALNEEFLSDRKVWVGPVFLLTTQLQIVLKSPMLFQDSPHVEVVQAIKDCVWLVFVHSRCLV